ncbi:MAG TPA: TadE/TadG family type IV pilus assembly protein, partial [Acidimicrobiales bacterium]|nr:TadE/TadG family type IV pilus assembly protein [Acidimicrobiales bacterium]
MEFAIVLPLLAMFMMGMFTGGLAYNNKQQITTSARDAARFGATLPANQCDLPSDCSGLSWAGLVRDLAVKRSNGTLATADVCVALVEGSGSTIPLVSDSKYTTKTDGKGCYADNSPDTGPRVQVHVTRQDTLDVVAWRKTLTLQADA